MADPRSLPKVDALAASEGLKPFPAEVRTKASRNAVARLRKRIMNGSEIAAGEGEQMAEEEACQLMQPALRPAINLSGVILHTGLGRARLASEAADQVFHAASHHSVVEFDLESGKRGDRQDQVRRLLTELTGAEDALVVNNAAAAVFLTLNALAACREVILSRGQMVEIGGSFRLPDIVRQSGCALAEVGCTNKTRLSDYSSAISDQTAAILRCHPSNYKIVGFTEEPSVKELSDLCRGERILLLDDVGAGCIVDVSRFGLPKQPTLQDSLKAGADIVMASGDKLLGGPQVGLILGKEELVRQIAKHPLARVVRVGKLSLAALEATLRLYSTGRESEIPVIRYMSRPLDEVRRMGSRLAKAYPRESELSKGLTEVGGGSLPGEGIPTWRAGLAASDPEKLAKALRLNNPPIIGRIEDGKLWLDPRTAEPGEIKVVERALREMGDH